MSPSLLRRRRTLMVNGVLAVLLIAAATFAYTSIGTSSSSAATRVRTGTVGRGTVVSTVSASGTLVSPSDLALSFVTGGVLRQLYVKVGDKVHTGEVLAKVDSTTQRESLSTAKSSLASAKASLTDLIQGQTPQQKAAAAVQLEQSQAQITQAESSLALTEKSNANDASNAAAAVDSAQSTVTSAKAALAAANATLAADKVSNPKNVAADQSKVDQDTQALDQASSSLTQAQQQQTSTALKNEQSLTQAKQQVSSAQLSYKAQVAQQAVSAAPPTASQLAQAKGQVTSAQVQVDSAQRALDGTTLKAPADGTVMSISTLVGGTVGSSSSSSSGSTGSSGSSGSTGSSGSSGSSGSTGSSGSGSSGSTGSSGSSGTSGSSSGTAGTADVTPAAAIAGHTATVTSGDSGFIVLTGITNLQVQASFSEDDTASLKVGQGATVTLNALPDTPVNATVSSISSTGTSSNGVVSYTVYLTLVHPPATLKPGQSGSVSVILKEADNTLYVPSTAVTTAGGVSTVTVVKGNTRTTTRVTIGVVGDTATQITSGLSLGQTVALSTATASSGTGFPAGGFPVGKVGGLTGGSLVGGGGGRG